MGLVVNFIPDRQTGRSSFTLHALWRIPARYGKKPDQAQLNT
ncbi:hypothetical protein [Microcoleus sp.]